MDNATARNKRMEIKEYEGKRGDKVEKERWKMQQQVINVRR